MNKDKSIIKISMMAVVFLIIISTIISITYSFYSASAVNNESVVGSTVGYDMDLSVELFSEAATGSLVPQLSDTTYLSQAITGTDSNQCIDANGNTVCQIYKITIKNKGGSTINVGGTLSLIGTTTDLKWEILKSSTTLNDPRVSHTASDKNIETSLLLSAGKSKDYYIVIWFEETGKAQTTKLTDSFSATVTFEGSGGSVSILLNNNIYHQVEYLEAKGTQYIDTGYKPNSNQKWVIKLKDESSSAGGNYMGSSDGTNRCSIVSYSSSRKIGTKVSGLSDLQEGSWDNDEHIYILDLGSKKLNYDNNIYQLSGNYGTFPNSNIWLFGDSVAKFSGKIYYSMIYDNGVLVRNFIPVYRVSDTEYGMFDLINEVFYPNVGTGIFNE